jgi:hypothetical protein
VTGPTADPASSTQAEKQLDAADLAPAAAELSAVEIDLLRGELTELRRQLIKGESEMAHFADLEARLGEAREALADHEALKNQFAELKAQHELVINSSSWRYTSLVRRIGALLNSRS